MTKVGLVSLGCAKNLVDSEEILAMFPMDRFSLTQDPKEADLIIVNTCGFITPAKKESIDTILEMAKYGAKLVVTGCLAERYAEELASSIPEADLVVTLDEYDKLHLLLMDLLGEKGILPKNPLRRVLATSSYSAYLRISDGCDNFCSFCAIPFIRGRFKSRPYEEIIQEAKNLKKQGVKEISLISQDTTVYGKDFKNKKPNIVDLLKDLEKIGFYSIRLLYLYPSEISEELIKLIASSKTIAHYFDIPVQCASDNLLTRMNRKCKQEDTRKLFLRIKELCPDAVLRTTLIAGFPGEKEEDVEQTLSFLYEIGFDKMGCFTYSREEGTAGYNMKPIVPDKTKQERKDTYMRVQQTISYRQNKKRIGEVMEGIVIKASQDGLSGRLRSYWNAPDDIDGNIEFTSSKPVKEGDIIKVKIEEASIYDLMGKAL